MYYVYADLVGSAVTLVHFSSKFRSTNDTAPPQQVQHLSCADGPNHHKRKSSQDNCQTYHFTVLDLAKVSSVLCHST